MPRPITEAIQDILEDYDPSRFNYSVVTPGTATRRCKEGWQEVGSYSDYGDTVLSIIAKAKETSHAAA